MPEVLVDLEGFEALAHEHGERFRGWYFSKGEIRKEAHPLNYEDRDLTYEFKVSDYNYRFVMPMKIEFSGGMIAYSDAERHLGVFRFPKNDEGRFSAPVKLDIQKELNSLTEEEIEDLLKRREVLTFEAFRIPQFGFEFVSIDDYDLDAIASITDRGFVRGVRATFESELNQRIAEVKRRIESIPNYLLILQNVLDFQLKDMAEVSAMSDKIIHT